jgi:hypothetical protein
MSITPTISFSDINFGDEEDQGETEEATLQKAAEEFRRFRRDSKNLRPPPTHHKILPYDDSLE